jgi:hypothetical protein
MFYAAYLSHMRVSRLAHVVLCDVLTPVDAIYDEKQKKKMKNSDILFTNVNKVHSNFQTKKIIYSAL